MGKAAYSGLGKGMASKARAFNHSKRNLATHSISNFVNIQANTSSVVVPPTPKWSALASLGANNSIIAIAIDSSNNIYAGGSFTTIGGSNAAYIAKWNPTTSAWTPLGSGTGGAVATIAIDSNNNVYVGGYFLNAGGSPANNIAKWNPTTSAWTSLGSGTDSSVNSIAIDSNDNVYVGGIFLNAGGSPASYIAKWNPTTSAWTSLGSGTDDTVATIAIDSNNNVYVGGMFDIAGGITVSGIAKWIPSSSTWSSSLGLGVESFSGPANVNSIAIDSTDNVYVGGTFTGIFGLSTEALNVAKWDGTTWSALNVGTSGVVYAIDTDSSGNVYVGGSFGTVGGTTVDITDMEGGTVVNRIAKWDGISWSALSSGLNNTVRTIAVDTSNNVYAGGAFTTAGGISVNRIAKWGV